MRRSVVLLALVVALLAPATQTSGASAPRRMVYTYRIDIAVPKADVTSNGGGDNVQAISKSDWGARWKANLLVDHKAKTVFITATTDMRFNGTTDIDGAYDDSKTGRHYTCHKFNLRVTTQLGKLILGGEDLGHGRLGLKVTPSLGYNPGIPIPCTAPTGPPQQVPIHWDAFGGSQSCIFAGNGGNEYRLIVPVAKLGQAKIFGHLSFGGQPSGSGCNGTSVFFGLTGSEVVRDTGSYHFELQLLAKRPAA